MRLKPIVQQYKNDTVFCFKTWQAKELAKLIEKGRYQDSIASRLEIENIRLFQVLETKDSTISKLEIKAVNVEQFTQNQQLTIELLDKTIVAKNKQIKRTRLQRTLLGIGLGIMTLLSVTN